MKRSTKELYHFPVAIPLHRSLLAVQAALGLRDSDTEAAILQARRWLKRVRATAAFVRKPRPSWLKCLERDARELHREMGEHRDCTVVAEYAAKLCGKHPDAVSLECLTALSSREASAVSEGTWVEWDQRVAALLEVVEARKATHTVDSVEALRRSFRRARRRREESISVDSVDAVHDLRKALQRLLAQIELLPGAVDWVEPAAVTAFAKAARRLGRVGNLALLEAELERLPVRTASERGARTRTVKWLQARRGRLLSRALSACEDLETKSPRKFAQSVVRARE